LPVGTVAYEENTTEEDVRLIWLGEGIDNKPRAMRGPGERYSDVILRLASEAKP
jgi:hypothetical protein